MSGKERFDSWEGLDMKKLFKATPSQCEGCVQRVGIEGCTAFGQRPYQYKSVLANVKCQERKVK